MSRSDLIKRIIPLLLACILFGSVFGGLAYAAPATFGPGSYKSSSILCDCDNGLCPDGTSGAGTLTATTVYNFS